MEGEEEVERRRKIGRGRGRGKTGRGRGEGERNNTVFMQSNRGKEEEAGTGKRRVTKER